MLRHNVTVRWLMFVLSAILLVFLFPHSSHIDQSREPGALWSGDTVRAVFSFPLYKEETIYEQEVDSAQTSVLPVFTPTGIDEATVRDSLATILLQIDSLGTVTGTSLGEKSVAWMRSLPAGERRERLGRLAEALVESLRDPLAQGIIDRSRATIDQDRIVVQRGAALEQEVMLSALYDSVMVMQRLEADLARRNIAPEEYAAAIDLYRAAAGPTFRYSPTLTEDAQRIAANAVSKTLGLVREGQVIVTPGELITEKTALMLRSYDRSQYLREEPRALYLRFLGSFGHVAILLGLPLFYLYSFRRRIYADNLQLGVILGAQLVVALMAWISIQLIAPLPIEYLILIPFLSTLMAILFDSRTAFYLTVVACLIVAGVRGADYSVAIALLSAGVLAAYTVRDIRNRVQLYRSIAYAVGGFTLAIIALGLEAGESLGAIGLQLAMAAVNAIISPVLTFGAIFMLENLFSVATDLKLLEYDDLNHPLLRQLADKAPGTYQHTLTIARLAESAASAVGANALQAKVGAYFHDVGKIARSEYFVENQMGMDNKHDKIKPEQSAKVIREHILDGIKIARQYGLPERIIDFIPTHHGTTTIQYFLDKAREEDEGVDEELYHYPGPLPHTRETAIVMLADAVEATTRSLPNPTAQKIRQTVDHIIKKRFGDGQLDHSDLTLADLTKIREAFVKNLIGMSHPRIQYKGDEAIGADEKVKKEIPYVDDPFGGLGVSREDGGRSSGSKRGRKRRDSDRGSKT